MFVFKNINIYAIMSVIQTGNFVQITPISGVFQSDIYLVSSIIKQPSLITITLQNTQNVFDVRILLINPDGHMIKGESQKYHLRFESDIAKLQRSSRQIGTGPLKFAMTGVEPIDINILVQMDDQTLTSACMTERYISSLCRNDDLWRRRIQRYYPDAEKFKEEGKSWKDYYVQLRKVIWIKSEEEDYADMENDEYFASGIDYAVHLGYLDVLKWMASMDPSNIPDPQDLNSAAEKGYMDILEWSAELNPPIYPSSACSAARGGQLDVLEWMTQLNPPIYPNKSSANAAAMGGHCNVLRWIASFDPAIYPDEEGASSAAWEGHLDVLKWMATLNPPIYPFQYATYGAAGGGHLNVLKWMASLDRPMFPDQKDADNAARGGYMDVLEWIALLDPPIYPNQ
jgi:hypothetical protein